MSGEELENLGRNLELLRMCDGLSLFVCLDEPGGDAYPLPYPGGFKFGGESYGPIWEDRAIPRLEPNPLSGRFQIAIPYLSVGKDRRYSGTVRWIFVC
jgi:hypothetical protein